MPDWFAPDVRHPALPFSVPNRNMALFTRFLLAFLMLGTSAKYGSIGLGGFRELDKKSHPNRRTYGACQRHDGRFDLL